MLKKKPKAQPLAEVKLKRVRTILASSCGRCDFDEAEGGLIDHCDKCCRRIVTELWAQLMGHKS